MLPPLSSTWPVLRTYDAAHSGCIALPLGGIGTGTVSLGGRGQLCDWEVMNRPNKGFTPPVWGGMHGTAAVILRTRDALGQVTARCLEAELQAPFAGNVGAPQQHHGLPRFREGDFSAAYPLAQVRLADPGMPLCVRLEAFNPLVPGDEAASSLPVAVLRYVLINDGTTPVDATVCASVVNFIGNDGRDGTSIGNCNTPRSSALDGLHGLLMHSTGVPAHDERWGTLALTTTATTGVSQRSAWADVTWGDTWLDFWDDLLTDGKLDEREVGTSATPRASLAVSTVVPAGGQREVTFVLAWHFPNRQTWTPTQQEAGKPALDPRENTIGNHYCTQFADAWAAAVHAAPLLATLEADTVRFVKALTDADLPLAVKDAALSNLSTLRSQTVFRTPDGHLFGWEGSHPHEGSCHGSCTHVWNYEHATAALFGGLARGMREIEFLHATAANGHMSFRTNLPLSKALDHQLAAADGQLGCLMKLHREWRNCGDDAWLRGVWPQARKALEFCWIAGGWDADRDGVMEGCQHNTMDVEYYGPNPQMQFWYLGALRAAAVLATHLGEQDFATRCNELAERGARWTDEHLFNGEWYVQQIRPPAADTPIAHGLRHESMGSRNLQDPDFQIGDGCLIDQLVGQVMAHLNGLGHLADPAKLATTARAVWKHTHHADLHGHFNHMRSFALNDEPAMVMATWPRGGRPKRPFPYCHEVMTGFEYTAALALILEGAVDDGVQAIADVRFRHDGQRRNPFDEAECGHHYARAMASWGAIAALTGLRWSAQTGDLELHRCTTATTGIWAVGDAWGTWRQQPERTAIRVTVTTLGGQLPLRSVTLSGSQMPVTIPALGVGQTVTVLVP